MSISQDISGNDNEIITVGGDFNLGGTVYYNENTDFYPLDLTELQTTDLPPNVAPLLSNINTHHLLIIGGPAKQKSQLLKHCASKLVKQHQSMEVFEWSKSASLQTIFSKLNKSECRCILLLPDISAFDIDYNIKALSKACQKQHYILISTEKSQQDWSIAPQFSDIWHSVDEQSLYYEQPLIEHLKTQYQALNFKYQPLESQHDSQNAHQQIISKLKTPDRIDQLLHLLASSSPQQRRNKSLDWFIDLVEHDDQMVIHWFKNILTLKEQMLAIGLSFFDGLIDDQCLSGIDQLVQDSWRKRDTSLQFVDYGDLTNLLNFFRLHHTSNEIYRISSNSKNLRLIILQAAWTTHKRLILASIPTLISIVRNSVQKRSNNPDLYGSIHRRDRLRQVLSETISDIGLISVKAGDQLLLQLAADDNTAVQKVAAKALASWYNHPRIDVYDKLINWLTSDRIAKSIVDVFEQRKIDKRQSPLTYVKNLVTLTLGFAGRYYSQNQLPDKLLYLIDTFISDNSHLATQSLCKHTLNTLIPLHLEQLQSRIVDLNRNPYIYQYIPSSLALSYQQYPQQIKEILEQWHFSPVNNTHGGTITKRERELACVALTYAKLPLRTESQNLFSDLTPAWAFEQLKFILSKHKHRFVRDHCLQAITLLVSQHFEAAEFEFQQLITSLTADERLKIIEQLGKIYLKQRQNLTGAEDYINFAQHSYPVWIETQRPKTEIENSMFRWITTSNDPLVLQFTYQCESYFKEILDIFEIDLIQQLQNERYIEILEASRQKAQKQAEVTLDFTVAKIHSLIERLGLFLLTLFSKRDVTMIVKSLMPIVITQDSEIRKLMLDTYESDGRSQIAKAIKRILKYARKVGIAVSVIVLLIVVSS